MKENEQMPGNPGRNERILQAISAQEWKSRLLIWVALVIGLLSIIAGIALAWWFRVWLDPRLQERNRPAAPYGVATASGS